MPDDKYLLCKKCTQPCSEFSSSIMNKYNYYVWAKKEKECKERKNDNYGISIRKNT